MSSGWVSPGFSCSEEEEESSRMWSACVNSLLAVGWDLEATSLHAKSLSHEHVPLPCFHGNTWLVNNCFRSHYYTSSRTVSWHIVTGIWNDLACLCFLPGGLIESDFHQQLKLPGNNFAFLSLSLKLFERLPIWCGHWFFWRVETRGHRCYQSLRSRRVWDRWNVLSFLDTADLHWSWAEGEVTMSS